MLLISINIIISVNIIRKKEEGERAREGGKNFEREIEKEGERGKGKDDMENVKNRLSGRKTK